MEWLNCYNIYIYIVYWIGESLNDENIINGITSICTRNVNTQEWKIGKRWWVLLHSFYFSLEWTTKIQRASAYLYKIGLHFCYIYILGFFFFLTYSICKAWLKIIRQIHCLSSFSHVHKRRAKKNYFAFQLAILNQCTIVTSLFQ